MRDSQRLSGRGLAKLALASAMAVGLVGTGVGLYLAYQPVHGKAARPLPPQVGQTSIAVAAHANFLAVLASQPIPASEGVPLEAVISMTFNLPVDPANVAAYFSVLPQVTGAFSQGSTPNDVLFTPTTGFLPGSSISVVVRKGLSSRDGYALPDDYSFRFRTAIPSGRATFESNGQLARLVNAASGIPVKLTVRLGQDVSPDLTLQIFHAGRNDLLAAFVHSAAGQYRAGLVNSTAMQLVDTRRSIKSGDQLTVAQPAGIYLVLAGAGRAQYGAVWIVFSRYGIILRQDDQRIVAAGIELGNPGATPRFDATFYTLLDGVRQVGAGSFTGTGSFPAPLPVVVDLAIATVAGEEVAVPVSAPETNADIKVVADLNRQARIFLTTDRPGYQQGETINFAGFARLSNDQAYSIPVGAAIRVWAATSQEPIAAQVDATVAADGTFAGSLVMPAGAFNRDGSDGWTTLRADLLPIQTSAYAAPFSTVISALGSHTSSARMTVVFDKPTYVSTDRIAAVITATGSDGRALANQAFQVSVYSTDHTVQPRETDSFAVPSSWGVPVQQTVEVRSDAAGQARYSFPANLANRAADQEVTLVARQAPAAGGNPAVAARTVIVYLGAGEVFFAPARSVYGLGDEIVAPYFVQNRSGGRAANLPMAYELDKTDYQGNVATTTVLAAGTQSTDANGFGTIRLKYSGPLGAVSLRLVGKDPAGTSFENASPLTISSDPGGLVSFGGDRLLRLNVATDKVAYSVGETAHLTVTSAVPERVFLSLERGRIHQYAWLTLVQGDNPVPLPITPDLAPGFTATFSHLIGGRYFTEGLPIRINNGDRLLKVTITTDRGTYVAGQKAHLSISATRAGAPAPAALVITAYDAQMSANRLIDWPSAAGAFLTPALRGTNASSSLTGIGDWGGRCGGGTNGGEPATINPGKSVSWIPRLSTDTSGKTSIETVLPAGVTRFAVFASGGQSTWGQSEVDIVAA
ncbi:MAG: hypothetical protein NVS9B1_19170 [Candidatus Dormibacteraceae bacterium]